MIAKTSIGGSFGSALEYGAGLKNGKEQKHSELLGTSNMMACDPKGMAAEMLAVADGSRCKSPVWHTSLNWPTGETIEPAQLLRAASEYCRQMGADPGRHQVAVYQHHDRPHTHIHIYINRVPVDGGPALDTSHNYARNVKVCQAVSQQLGMSQVPGQRQSLNDHDPHKQSSRAYVQTELKMALADMRISTTDQLRERLLEKGIESQFKQDSQDRLVGCSFRYDQTAMKGSEVGHKAQQIGQQLGHNQQEQRQSQDAWNALFTGYAAAKEQDQWQTLLKGYEQTKEQTMKSTLTQEEKSSEIEEKQQIKPNRGLRL